MNDNVIDIKLIGHDMASSVLKGVNTSVNSFQDKIKGAIATVTALTTAGLVAMGGMAIKTGADFESLRASLLTSLGNSEEAAASAEKVIKKFASTTPFGVQQVTQAFIKLKNLGLDPSEKALRSYGDTASAMGKTLNDMIEAVADASTGEFERLKEFGIRASQQGDKVSFTFKGVTTTVKKNSKDIEDYLIKLGEVNFAGGMEKQSKTLNGVFSGLMDTISFALDEFANASGLLDFLKGLGNELSNLAGSADIKGFGETLKNLAGIVSGFFKSWSSDDAFYAIDALSKFFPEDQAEKIAESINKVFYQFRDFTQYLVDNKDATVAALAAIAITIMATFVPALVTAVATAAPFILILGAIGAAVFFLKKGWDENWYGMRDTLTNVWNNVLLPTFNHLKRVFDEQLKPTIDRFLAETWPKLQADLVKLKPILDVLVYVIGVVLVAAFAALVVFLDQSIRNFAKFMDFVNNNYEKIKAFANLLASIQKMDWGSFTANAKILGLPGFANGTDYAPGGMAMVGEKGPELVYLPRGSQVKTAGETQQAMGEKSITINNIFNNQQDGMDIANQMAFQVKNLNYR